MNDMVQCPKCGKEYRKRDENCCWINCECGISICGMCGSTNLVSIHEEGDEESDEDQYWCCFKCDDCGLVGCGMCIQIERIKMTVTYEGKEVCPYCHNEMVIEKRREMIKDNPMNSATAKRGKWGGIVPSDTYPTFIPTITNTFMICRACGFEQPKD